MSLYDDLGVDKGASAADVKNAFRKRASKAHPDRGGDTAQFQVIQRAYAILSNPAKREKYDQTGATEDEQSPLLHILAAMFLREIDQTESVDQVNLLAGVRKKLGIQISEGQQHILQVEGRIAKHQRALKRIKKKAGPNMIAAIIEGHVAKLRQSIAAAEHDRDTCVALLDMLDDYDYEIEAPPGAFDIPAEYHHMFRFTKGMGL